MILIWIVFQGGMTLKVTDAGDMPYSVWGKVKTQIEGWVVSARLAAQSDSMSKVAVNVQAQGGPLDTTVTVSSVADVEGGDVTVGALALQQSVDVPGGRLTVAPTYHVATDQAHLALTYGTDGATIGLSGNLETQKLSVAKSVGSKNTITPTITSNGDVSVAYTRLIQSGALTTTVEPKKAVKVNWSDGKWALNVHAPLVGNMVDTDQIKFSATCKGV